MKHTFGNSQINQYTKNEIVNKYLPFIYCLLGVVALARIFVKQATRFYFFISKHS